MRYIVNYMPFHKTPNTFTAKKKEELH